MSDMIEQEIHVIGDLESASDFELKHTPGFEIIEADGKTLARVSIGLKGIGHPQTEAHLIEWIRLFVDGILAGEVNFGSEDVPVAEFEVSPGVEFFVQASCNLHGVWQSV